MVWARALGALWNFGFSFVVINGVPVPVGRDHDLFQWFAEIWIPAAIGLITVFVSGVALVISHRATTIANQVEDQRVAAESARDALARTERMQDMAIVEARALTRWVNAAAKSLHWEHVPLEEVGEAVHGPTLAAEARVLLAQSLVPGAQELLELVELEVENLYRFTPDAMYMPDRSGNYLNSYARSDLLSGVTPIRRERVLSTIRRWAADPEGFSPEVSRVLGRARSDPQTYWDYRQGLAAENLAPLVELPDPPAQYDERRRFFAERELLPKEPEVESS